MATLNPTKRLSPIESARFILDNLRADVGNFPEHLTPKYPLPTYMQTEQQVALMQKFAVEDGCNELACIGTDVEEVNALLYKGWLLRARILLRRLKRGEGDGNIAYQEIMELVDNGAVSVEALKYSIEEITALYSTKLQ